MWILWLGLGIFAGLLLILLICWPSNNLITTTRYTVNADIERPVKIVQISDLHGKTFGRHNRRLIARVAEQNPDFIVVTGDIVHRYNERNIKNALELVAALSKEYPVLFAAGNHELRNVGYDTFKPELEAAGACVLDDCPRNMLGLTVIGLKSSSLKNDKMFEVDTGGEGYKIALAHYPHFLEKYEKAGYDLVLSGHAHGGQWRIPFIRRGIYAPGQGLFPKYTDGMHTAGKTKMIISRGLGNSEFPLRLNNCPELVVINLEK